MNKFSVAVAALIFLGGCAHNPTLAEQAAADYGTPIEQSVAQDKVVEFMRTRLKDPMSAVYDWGPIHQGYVGAAPLMGRKNPTYGYSINVQVNSKNSFGGYTGATPYFFLFRDGSMVYSARQECSTYGSCTMMPIN